MTRTALAQPRVAVLWSVAIARLVLSLAAASAAPVLLVDLSSYDTVEASGSGEALVAPRLTVAAVAMLVLWLGLEVFARTDPRWRTWARRRRRLTGERLQPGLATVPLAFVTGASAGLAAVAAGHVLVGPDVFVDGEIPSDIAPTTSELTAFFLLVAYFLLVASSHSAGRTVCACGAAGVSAGLATTWVSALSSPLLTVTAWPLVLLVVALLVALRPVDDVRQRLYGAVGRTVRRWVRSTTPEQTWPVSPPPGLRGVLTTRR